VSSLTGSNYSLSMAEAVSTKVQPYLVRADAILTEINTNKSKITAYQNMQSALQALQTAAANLSSQATTGTNVFSSRQANLTSTSIVSGGTPSNASALMTASVASGTNTGTHTVVVNQIASAEEDVSSTLNKSSTAALGYAGTFSITETGKAVSNITVTSGMSLTDIASAINGAESQTGVSASVVSIDSSHSVLVVSGNDPDTPLQFNQDSYSVLSQLGVSGTTVTGSTSETNSTTALGLAGTFTINGGTTSPGNVATPVTVTITSSMTLAQIAAAINSQAQTTLGSTTAFAASVNGSNQLRITTGNNNAGSFSGVTGNVLSSLGLSTFTSNAAMNQVQAATPASLTVDGISGITRSSNTVTDVLTGVTLNLTAADPNTQVTLTVAPNTGAATTAIAAFVSAYNNWESFVSQNEATNSDGTASASAVLFGDSTLRQTSLAVDNTVTSMVNGLALGDVGVSMNSSNRLQIDVTTLTSSLTNNFTGVFNMFQSTVSSSNTALQTLGTDYSNYAGTFTLGVTTNASGTITGVSVNGSPSSAFTISGSTISGAYGSSYSGMAFSFSGAAGTTTTATISATQGLANQIYTTANNYGNSLNGTVESLVTSLQSTDATLESQYNLIINQANDYTTFLLQQYASLTTQIASASYTTTVLNDMFAMGTKG
jgi:flagellar hook-associated protein 2